MKFHQYYKKVWYQSWWFRILCLVVLVIIGLALWLGLSVYKEVRYLSQNPDQISVFQGAQPSSTLTILEMRALVETRDDPFFGPEDAKAVVVEFGDFECPFCGRSFPVVRAAMNRYKDKVKFIYRDFPISTHAYAAKAAEAGECAWEQGKFWEMHDKIFLNQNKMSVEDLKRYAKQIQLDMTAFTLCLDSDSKREEVEEDMTAGIKAGVQGTPTFYFNGFPWFGAIDEETMEAILVKLLEQTQE